MRGTTFWLTAVLLTACGGGETPTTTTTSGDEAPLPPLGEAPPREGTCIDPEGGGVYVYLGADAAALVLPDQTREPWDTDDLEDTARESAREVIAARASGAPVHIVSDEYAEPEDTELLLRVLAGEELTVDACTPGETSPFPTAADALRTL